MNTYIYGISTPDGYLEIKKVYANSILNAEEKLIDKYSNRYDLECDDFLDLQEKLDHDRDIMISDVYNVEEFY